MKHLYLCAAALAGALAAHAQALTVTSFEPARNSPAAARTAPVRLGFSQPVGAGVVRVFSSQRGGQLAGTTSASGNVLTFKPARDFLPGETVQVTLPATTQGSTGLPLAAAQVYQFTTAVAPSTGVFEEGSSVALSTLSNTSIYPCSIATADVDGDGDLDLLVSNSNYNPGTVSVRLNDGTGFYSGGTEVTVGNFGGVLTMADVNGDGSLDLLIPVTGQGLVVQLNDGKGTFRAGSVVPASTSILPADVDGDGDLDLVTAGSRLMTIFRNDGTGQFSVGPMLASGNRALAVGDLDGDGALDVVCDEPNQFTGNLLLRRGKGDGTFAATTVTVPVGSSGHPVTVTGTTLADLDADGDLDLLASTYNNGIYSLRNDGQGRFDAALLLPGSAGYGVVQLADLDGDGDLDVLALSSGTTATNAVLGCLNDGRGTFATGRVLATDESLSALATADVDSDGDLDLLTVGSFSRRARIRLNQNVLYDALTINGVSPAGNLANVARTSPVAITFSRALAALPATVQGVKVTGAQRGSPAAPAATVAGATWQLQPTVPFLPGEKVSVSVTRAMRGSGARLRTPQVYQFTTAAGVGPGTFVPAQSLPSGGYSPRIVIPADLNGDGYPELCTLGSYKYGEVSIAPNLGGGKFGTTSYLGIDQYPTGLSVADMDGDGDLDLVTGSGDGYAVSPGKVRVYTNNGAGSFSTGPALVLSTQTYGLATGDLDGDGDQDLLVLVGSYKAQVLSNENDGTFTPQPIFTVGADANLALGDVDNDGDLDLLTTNSERLAVSLNAGDATFAPYVLTTVAGGALALADIDSDNDLDVLLSTGSLVNVLPNDGHGAFSLRESLPVEGGSLGAVTTGDIDGDGDVDLVSGGTSLSGYVSVRLNDGRGHFSGSYNPLVAASLTMPLGVALADLDGDGDLDLSVLLYNVSGLRVCLNQAAVVTAAPAPAASLGISLMPNPARHSAALAGAQPGALVQVLDAAGRLVLTATATATGQCQLALPPGLAGGIYVVRAGEQTVRLAIE